MRLAMSKILGKQYDVIEAEHGEDAWTLLINDNSIQVLFTDLSMPYLDGYGLLDRMRASDDPHLQNMPVIIITGKEDDDEAKQQAIDHGASDFISKPFESIQLLARAKAHVSFQQTSTILTSTQEKLERQAAVDEVTGLAGQRYFCKAAEETLAYSARHGGQYILIRMDLDNFDHIFIKNGKKAADAILNSIGTQLLGMVRKEDMLARIGLAKFAMLLRDTPMDKAKQLAKRITGEITNLRFKLNNGDAAIKISLSFGIYEPDISKEPSFPLQLVSTEEYLQQAAKKEGSHYVAYSSVNEISSNQANLETALNHIKHNETEILKNQVRALARRMVPILDFVAKHFGAEAIELVKKLKLKILS
ncbi:hypothetical protein MNBD_GAMMA21-3004 [hydrothermal vent metagenome]|uniref:Uncharacterized protein n=1 Tax=hydrothermal vent metagenome TaxID=652676 RepID=A0A3B1A3G6_9ZZZZ